MELGYYMDGRRLTYRQETGTFDIGQAPVTADYVRGYDAAGQIRWDRPEYRGWFYANFPAPQPHMGGIDSSLSRWMDSGVGFDSFDS